MNRSRAVVIRCVAWFLLACGGGGLACIVVGTHSAATANAVAGSCVPQLTQAQWLTKLGSAAAQIQVAWQWLPPTDDGATVRVLVTDEANPDPTTNHTLDPRAIPAAAGSGDTLNWYPTTEHLAQLVVSQPGGPCDGTDSAGAPVTFASALVVPSPTDGPVSQAMGLPGSTVLPGTPTRTASGSGSGSGGACLGPVCSPTFPDPGQALSNAIVSGLTALLADFIAWLSGFLQSIISWATAGSTCMTGGTSPSTFTLLSGTPPCLTWTNPYVQTYATLCRTIALSLVALLICLHGLEIALATRAGHTFDGPLDALRRVALAAVLGSVLVGSNGSNGLFGAVLALANAMTAAVGGGTLPAVPVTGPGAALQNALVSLLYLVMELILIVQLLLRLALLDLLLVIAPLAVLCYAYPRWASWATHWAQLTAATVLLQFLQVTALQVSAKMVASLDISSAGAASASVLQTLLGIAGLVLVVRLPRLLYGLGSGVLGGGLPFALGWDGSGAGASASPTANGGTTTVSPDNTLPQLASGGSSGSSTALPSAAGPQGGPSAGGPLYPGGSSGRGTGLVPVGGASAAPFAPASGLVPTDEGDSPWGSVIITEVPPAQLPPAAPQLEGPQPASGASGGGTDATPPPGGWP